MADELELRDVIEADLPVFFAQQDDREANRMAAVAARDRPAFFAHWRGILRDDSVGKQTVLYQGRVAGNVVCFERGGERLVGYWFGREFWGRGVATRALAAFVRRIPERPLRARVAWHNTASIRVLEKCGFVRCGEDAVADGGAQGEPVLELVLQLDGPRSPARGA